MYKVTPSSIGLLLECPRCLWLYVNENIKRPRGIFPSLPGGMDGIFKVYFDIYRKKGGVPPEIKGKIKDNEKLFDDFKKLNPWRDIDFGRGGLKASFPEYNIFLQGAIDELLITDDKKYVPFDFKTRGYPTKKDTHKHYQHQLDLYSLLFEKNNLPPADHGYLLFFWPKYYKKGKTKFDSELIKMKIGPKNGLEILKETNKIVKGKKPKVHKKCEYCLYRDKFD